MLRNFESVANECGHLIARAAIFPRVINHSRVFAESAHAESRERVTSVITYGRRGREGGEVGGEFMCVARAIYYRPVKHIHAVSISLSPSDRANEQIAYRASLC